MSVRERAVRRNTVKGLIFDGAHFAYSQGGRRSRSPADCQRLRMVMSPISCSLRSCRDEHSVPCHLVASELVYSVMKLWLLSLPIQILKALLVNGFNKIIIKGLIYPYKNSVIRFIIMEKRHQILNTNSLFVFIEITLDSDGEDLMRYRLPSTDFSLSQALPNFTL